MVVADTVEFYEDGNHQPFMTLDSAFAPNDGDLVNIRGETWVVLGRSFAVDYADERLRRQMRCNLIVERKTP
jgi:hypothetical protein